MIIGYSRASSAFSNLQFWYRADAISGYSDNTAITASPGWPNSATNGNFPTYKLVPGSGGSPIYHTTGFNGLPKVSFASASAQWLAIKSGGAFVDISAFTAATAYIVAKINNDPPLDPGVGGGDWGFWQAGDPNLPTAHPYTDSVVYEGWCTTARKTVGNPTPSLANLHLYSVTTAAGSYRVHLNGTEIFSTVTNTASFTNTFTPMGIGYSTTFAILGYLNGDVAEHMIFDVAHDDTARAAVETYLTDKWAI